MRAEYFLRALRQLEALIDPGELMLARGRAFEPHLWDGLDLTSAVSGPGDALLVTERRGLWLGRDDERWVRELPFAVVRSYTEFTQAHRYALVFEHDGIERLQCEPAHRFLAWSWGNAEAMRRVTSSVLAFSHRDTAAARAIRGQLDAAGVPAGEPRSLPKQARRGEVPYAILTP